MDFNNSGEKNFRLPLLTIGILIFVLIPFAKGYYNLGGFWKFRGFYAAPVPTNPKGKFNFISAFDGQYYMAWGGEEYSATYVNTGYKYDVRAGTWSAMAASTLSARICSCA